MCGLSRWRLHSCRESWRSFTITTTWCATISQVNVRRSYHSPSSCRWCRWTHPREHEGIAVSSSIQWFAVLVGKTSLVATKLSHKQQTSRWYSQQLVQRSRMQRALALSSTKHKSNKNLPPARIHGSEQEIVESANQIDILLPEGIGGERGDTFASSKQWVFYRFCFDIDSTPFSMSSSKQLYELWLWPISGQSSHNTSWVWQCKWLRWEISYLACQSRVIEFENFVEQLE